MLTNQESCLMILCELKRESVNVSPAYSGWKILTLNVLLQWWTRTSGSLNNIPFSALRWFDRYNFKFIETMSWSGHQMLAHLSANNTTTVKARWQGEKNQKVMTWFKMERLQKGWNNMEKQRGRKNGKQRQRLFERCYHPPPFFSSPGGNASSVIRRKLDWLCHHSRRHTPTPHTHKHSQVLNT